MILYPRRSQPQVAWFRLPRGTNAIIAGVAASPSPTLLFYNSAHYIALGAAAGYTARSSGHILRTGTIMYGLGPAR
jgi:hypothetical protein